MTGDVARADVVTTTVDPYADRLDHKGAIDSAADDNGLITVPPAESF